MPCCDFQNDECSIYEHQFSSCKGYECHVLRRFKNGLLTLEPALSTVAQAPTLIDCLEARLEGSTRERLVDTLNNVRPGSETANSTDSWSPEDRLDLGELLILLGREFRQQTSGAK